MAERTRWIVTTSGDRPLPDIQKDMKNTGFAVDQVFDEIGCISGACDDNVAAKVRKIRGVADVSPEGQVDIGPPNAPVTW
jgi:hypothetical protein